MFSNTRRYADIDYMSLIEKAKIACSFSSEGFKVICRENTIKKHIKRIHMVKECNAVPFFWAHIMSNHDVFSCSAYLKDERFNLGNLADKSFHDIWVGELREECLRMISNSFDITQCRINCRMSAVNHYLWNMRNPVTHMNFI